MNSYREQQLRELLEVSRRTEVKLSFSQVESLLAWQETSPGDVRRLIGALDADQRSMLKASRLRGAQAD